MCSPSSSSSFSASTAAVPSPFPFAFSISSSFSSSSSSSSSSYSLLKDSLGSAFIRPTNKKKTMKYAKKLNKNKDRISDDQFLFIQNDFTPSSMATQLTDEKLYKK